MFHGWANIPSDLAMFAKGGASFRSKVSNNFSTRWCDWGAIEIEGSIKGGMSRKRRMNSRGTKKIEREECLQEETIPFGKWKLGVNGAKYRNKVILECSNGTFCCIDTMFLWGNALKINIVFQEGIFESLRAFIVEDMKLRSVTLVQKCLVNGFSSSADAGCLPIGNGNGMNSIGVLMVEHNDVVVATT